jgi:hypothetical protein
MSTQEDDRHIIRLLQLHAGYSQKVEQFSNLGLEINEALDVIDLNLLHLALDMLGVPADNSLAWSCMEDVPKTTPPDWLYCRDWFVNRFDDIVKEGTTLEYLTYIQDVREVLKKGSKK